MQPVLESKELLASLQSTAQRFGRPVLGCKMESPTLKPVLWLLSFLSLELPLSFVSATFRNDAHEFEVPLVLFRLPERFTVVAEQKTD